MCFSSCRRRLTSAPYLPTVPSSTRRKWECRLLRTFSLLRGLSSVWYGAIICSMDMGRGEKKMSLSLYKTMEHFEMNHKWGCRKSLLTSLPMRSFLFSMTPQGAIPIVQIFFEDLEQCSLRASPTCLATPVRGMDGKKKSFTLISDCIKLYFY